MSKESRQEYKRRWQRENKDKVKAARERYLNKNRETIAKRSQEWRKNNPEKLKELKPHWHRMSTYGITKEEYEEKLRFQKNKCAICGHEPLKGQKRLCVDHCHSTGLFRGLLCQSCNRGIGLIGESKEKLIKALIYLKWDPYKD